MITGDLLDSAIKLLHKHKTLLIDAHLKNNNAVDESEDNFNAIDAMINARLLWRPAENEPVRLTRELTSVFERVTRDPRRLTVDADVGGFLNSLENNVNRYKDAIRTRSNEDVKHFLGQIERIVDDLRSSLLASSNHLWEKINNEFGYVQSLELKIKENKTVLAQSRRINDSLELIKVDEIDEMAGNDRELRRYLHGWLLSAVELCRREMVDTIHKLNELLFEYRKQQKLGRLIDGFYRRYQSDPAYKPFDYSESDPPEILNQIGAMTLNGHADTTDPENEIMLIKLICGVRKEREVIEIADTDQAINVTSDSEPIEMKLSALRQAVEDFYLSVIDENKPLSVISNTPPVDIEPEAELWLYAVIARYNNMDHEERTLFTITYQESIDPLFNGRLLVHDATLELNKQAI